MNDEGRTPAQVLHEAQALLANVRAALRIRVRQYWPGALLCSTLGFLNAFLVIFNARDAWEQWSWTSALLACWAAWPAWVLLRIVATELAGWLMMASAVFRLRVFVAQLKRGNSDA